MSKNTLSTIVQRNLDLNAELDDIAALNSNRTQAVSASITLLNEKKKLKRIAYAEEDFIPLKPVDPLVTDEYLNQIAQSGIDKPKYWTSTKDKTNSASKVVKSAGITSNGQKFRRGCNKQQYMKITKKGEDYKNRYTEKVLGKVSKLNRKNKLKL